MSNWRDLYLKPPQSQPPQPIYTVNQRTGCCGFAATLMALLVRAIGKDRAAQQMLDDLEGCIDNKGTFAGITKSTRIKDRLERRAQVKTQIRGLQTVPATTKQEALFTIPIIGKTIYHTVTVPQHQVLVTGTRTGLRFLDEWGYSRSVALMILFKEYVKEAGQDQIWQECLNYSLNWNWSYGNTVSGGKQDQGGTGIKSLLNSGGSMDGMELSYKRGDLGVPAQLIDELLGMAGLKVAAATKLVDGKGGPSFGSLKGTHAAGALKMSQFTADMRKNQLGGLSKKDYILGVGHDFDTKWDQYLHVTHWVYVPAVPDKAPAMNDFKVWSWGGEHNMWGGLAAAVSSPPYHYYPVYLIELA